MPTGKQLSHWIGTTLVALLLLACGTPQPTPTVTQEPTATVSPTATEVPVWDYVALGDPNVFGMMPIYAQMIEQDLGVKVEIHSWEMGGDYSRRLLDRLRTNDQMRNDLREAEVITIEIPNAGLRQPSFTFAYGKSGDCGGDDNQDCLREAFGAHRADTDEIIAEIVSLRSPNDAVIRAVDMYQFMVSESHDTGWFEVYNPYWREKNAHLIETASRYGIRVARVYDAFMGEGGAEDPRDKGLVKADGIHPTPEGARLMAELLRDLGYAPLVP